MGIDIQRSFFVPDFQVGVIDARYVALMHHIALPCNGAQIDAHLHQYRHYPPLVLKDSGKSAS
jgi:hypothetical protein